PPGEAAMRSSMRARRLLGATALAIAVLVAMAPVAAVAAPTVSAHDRKGPVVTPLTEVGSDDFVIGSTIGPDGRSMSRTAWPARGRASTAPPGEAPRTPPG